jgi:hypothetical protein
MSAEERGAGGLFASFGTPLRKVKLASPTRGSTVAACRPFSVRRDIPQRYEDGSSSAPIINCLIVVPIRPLVLIAGGALALAGGLYLRCRSAD